MRDLSQYIISLCAAGLLSSILMGLSSRQGSHKTIISFLCGISMLLTVLTPWVTFRLEDISLLTNEVQDASLAAVSRGEIYAKESVRDIIKSRLETYILDKATALNLQVTVEVEIGEDDIGTPQRVYLRGAAAPYVRTQLTDYIVNTLGIAKENQIWT